MEKRHHTALCAANFQPQNINLLFWTLFWKLGKNLNHWMWDRTRCAAFSIVLLTGVCYQSLVVQINQNTNASNQCFHGGYCFLPWLLFSRISPWSLLLKCMQGHWFQLLSWETPSVLYSQFPRDFQVALTNCNCWCCQQWLFQVMTLFFRQVAPLFTVH